jgi:hypothetical protein
VLDARLTTCSGKQYCCEIQRSNGRTVRNTTTYKTIYGPEKWFGECLILIEVKIITDVTEDTRKLGERNWRNAVRNRDSWQNLPKKALAKKGLLCQ